MLSSQVIIWPGIKGVQGSVSQGRWHSLEMNYRKVVKTKRETCAVEFLLWKEPAWQSYVTS